MSEKILIDDDTTVSISYDGDAIEIEKEVGFPCGENNYYRDVNITLNKRDALILVEFINQNLDKLK